MCDPCQPKPMELGLALLLGTFNKYAGQDGDADTLTKAELSKLLKEEFPMATGGKVSAADEFISLLDTDGDKKMNFMEFCMMLGTFGLAVKEILGGLEQKRS